MPFPSFTFKDIAFFFSKTFLDSFPHAGKYTWNDGCDAQDLAQPSLVQGCISNRAQLKSPLACLKWRHVATACDGISMANNESS